MVVAVSAVAALLGGTGVRAADLQLDAKVNTDGMQERTFSGTLAVEDGRFDEFFGKGSFRLRVSGRVNGDQIKLTGQIIDTGLMSAQVLPGSFEASGQFKDGRFVVEFKAHPESVSWNSSVHDKILYRGTVVVIDPTLQAAAAAAASQATTSSAVASATSAAPAASAEAVLQPVGKSNYKTPAPLPIHAAPNAQSAVVAVLPTGRRAAILGRIAGQNWYAIGGGGKRLGYAELDSAALSTGYSLADAEDATAKSGAAAAQPGAAPTAPGETAAAPPPEPPLSRSQRFAIQGQLAALGLYTGGIDGNLGPGTRKAIKAFQSANKLDSTGYATDATMRLLAAKAAEREQQLASDGAAAAAAPATTAVPSTTVAPPAAPAVPAIASGGEAPPPPPGAVATSETTPPAAPATTGAITAAAITVPDDLEPVDTVFVAASATNVRAQPNVGAAVVRPLTPGEHVYVLGKLPGKQWYLVSDGTNPIGYVIATWLVAESEYGKAPTKTAEAPAAAPPTPPTPPPAPDPLQALADIPFGSYHALVIGNDAYRKLPHLASAGRDAAAVADVLHQHYGFEVETLVDATREQIIASLSALRKRLTAADNLLIYYAGHGVYDEAADRGYWLPVDAERDSPSNWVSNADITDMIKAMQAKHVLIVADSCYSGTLTRGLAVAQTDAGYLRRMAEKRARTALTSGGLEPVLDAGGSNGHSVFAGAFIDVLMGNSGVMDGQELFARISEPVAVNAPQTPEYGDVRFAGHDGGDFIFVRRD